MSLNRVIGDGSKIPWHLPEDFKWFKQVTMGQVLVMGRKTFESIGRPLPGRETIVLTRGTWTHPGVKVIHDWQELREPTPNPSTEGSQTSGASETPVPLLGGARGGLPENPANRRIFIAGGAEIYRQALPWCGELLLTLVKREVAGDVLFPAFEDEFELVEEIRDTPEFKILRYRRK